MSLFVDSFKLTYIYSALSVYFPLKILNVYIQITTTKYNVTHINVIMRI